MYAAGCASAAMTLTVTHSTRRVMPAKSGDRNRIADKMRHLLVSLSIALAFVGCTPHADQPSPDDKMQTSPDSFKIKRPASDNGLAWDVIEIMWEHGDFYEDDETYRRSVQPATRGQLAVYACTWYLSEVNNGGHDQFFSNSTGMVWEDALTGFQLLGATEHRQILTEAIAVFPDSKPAKDRQKRWDQMENADTSAFDKLDDRLYALEEDFDALATKYILDHPDEFFVNPIDSHSSKALHQE